MPRGLEHLGLQLEGGVGHVGVLGEQREQRGVAGRGLGEDRADAVEPLELLATLALGDLLVVLHPEPLRAGEECDDLELRAGRGSDGAPLDPLLDLAHRAGEHRDDALVVEVTAHALGAPTRGPLRAAWTPHGCCPRAQCLTTPTPPPPLGRTRAHAGAG